MSTSMNPAIADNDRIEAAVELYEQHLRPGCNKLMELNKVLLLAERKQRLKRIGYRVGWICGLSLMVILISYLISGINILTAVGVLMAYFVGLFLHDRFSPKIVLPEQENELKSVNNGLRAKILSLENTYPENLFTLLGILKLREKAQSRGIKLEEDALDEYKLDGDGLYHYLDGMNFLMEHRQELQRIKNGSL